ncbi:hypothetical protein HBZC1_10080 [Helicobacter bizzozeronii CIII-1]|uniref:Uncharacterized protein n=1 Tax=Helicobacter bizzozeronii (strain CIII-1) TaxID=1002804 RepID=F8KQ79_HELBC|nr:hypothetical protein [Helicobacter bizzozeronii]CCB79994.1 hypothetical protein HBZC1_10080 [Helicobacter bizzozeronii CIII-1]
MHTYGSLIIENLTIEHLVIKSLTISDLKDWGIKVGGGGVEHAPKSYSSPRHNPTQESSYKVASAECDRLHRELTNTNKHAQELQNQLKDVLGWAASLCPHLGLTPPDPQLTPVAQIKSLLEQEPNPKQQEDLDELGTELCFLAQNLELKLEDMDMGKKDERTPKKLEKMVVEIQQAVKQLQEQVKGLRKELEGPEGLREKYAKLEGEKGAVEEELGEKEKELEKRDATIKDLQEKEIPDLQSKLGIEEGKVKKLGEDLKVEALKATNLGNDLENLRQEKAQLETDALQKEKELGEQITSLKTQMATLKGFEPYQELLKLAQEHPNLGLVANTPEDLLNEIYKAPKNLMKKVAENTLKSIKEKTADAPIWIDYFERLFAILQDFLGLQRLAIKEGDAYNPAKFEALGKPNRQGKVGKVLFQGYQIKGETVAYSLVEMQ